MCRPYTALIMSLAQIYHYHILIQLLTWLKHEEAQMAILILINKTKAHNFNFQFFKSLFLLLPTTKIFLPFGLGHDHQETTKDSFAIGFDCSL